MIAEVHSENTVLDYTAEAKPLSIEDIHKDMIEAQENYHNPTELVMWEQQWDWITKPFLKEHKLQPWMNLLPIDGNLRFEKNTLLGMLVRFA